MAPVDSEIVLGWLKAAGEDSRLRLLALCARQELSVSDLAEALRQSEPRVSRHLRILCEAGLLERLRQGQWVHYRLTRDAAAAAFVQGVLGQVDRNDVLFTKDQQRAAGVRAGGDAGAGDGGASALADRASESRLGRALKGFVGAVDVALSRAAAGGIVGARGDADRHGAVGARDEADRHGAAGAIGAGAEVTRALVVGVEHLELLEAATAAADECVAIAHSRRAAQSARAYVERHGLTCRVVMAASSQGLSEKDIQAAGAPFDVV